MSRATATVASQERRLTFAENPSRSRLLRHKSPREGRQDGKPDRSSPVQLALVKQAEANEDRQGHQRIGGDECVPAVSQPAPAIGQPVRVRPTAPRDKRA